MLYLYILQLESYLILHCQNVTSHCSQVISLVFFSILSCDSEPCMETYLYIHSLCKESWMWVWIMDTYFKKNWKIKIIYSWSLKIQFVSFLKLYLLLKLAFIFSSIRSVYRTVQQGQYFLGECWQFLYIALVVCTFLWPWIWTS